MMVSLYVPILEPAPSQTTPMSLVEYRWQVSSVAAHCPFAPAAMQLYWSGLKQGVAAGEHESLGHLNWSMRYLRSNRFT
jgi:hypothetical protein